MSDRQTGRAAEVTLPSLLDIYHYVSSSRCVEHIPSPLLVQQINCFLTRSPIQNSHSCSSAA